MRTPRLISAGLLAASLLSADKIVTDIELKDLPAAVHDAASKRTPAGGVLRSFEREVINGETFYEVKMSLPNKGSREILFRPDGSIFEVEEPSTLSAVPPAARAAIQNAAKSGELVKVDLITRGSLVLYEGEIQKDGRKRSVRFDSAGRLVE